MMPDAYVAQRSEQGASRAHAARISGQRPHIYTCSNTSLDGDFSFRYNEASKRPLPIWVAHVPARQGMTAPHGRA